MAGTRYALITGCTPGGIGYALAREFLAEGFQVIATARSDAVLQEIKNKGDLHTVQLDVANGDSITKAHAEIEVITGGKLHVLVNNAGRTHTHPATDLDMSDVRATFETNVFGVMAMCASFSDHLIAARGLIINIASLAAVYPYVFGSAYCASKGAVVSYSRTLRQELAPFGVRVMIAMVGAVQSNIASYTHRKLPPDSLYEPVRDVFEWRLVFSQNHATVKTEEFAKKLVKSAVAPEVPVILRSWFGRPDWFWAGGRAGVLWAGSWFGEWLTDLVAFYMFKMNRLAQIVEEEKSLKKD